MEDNKYIRSRAVPNSLVKFDILLVYIYIPYLQQIKIVFKKPSLKNNCFEVLLPKLLIRYSFVGLVVCTGGWKNS